MFSKKQWLQPEKPSKWIVTQEIARKPLLAAFLFNSNKKPEVGESFFSSFSADTVKWFTLFAEVMKGWSFHTKLFICCFSRSLNGVISLSEGLSLQISTC